MVSHLTTLLKRVRAVPKKLKTEPIFYNRLINLAEYLRYEDDYSNFEERKATSILKIYKLDILLNIEDDEDFERTIKNLEIFKRKGFSRTCCNCGRSLSRPESIRHGYGNVCYSKRQIVDASRPLTDFFDRLGDDGNDNGKISKN